MKMSLLLADYGLRPIPPAASCGPLPLTAAWAQTVCKQQ